MIGLAIGIIRFAWESAYTQVICGREGEDKRPAVIKDVHYLYFGMLLFGIVFIIVVVLSLLTKPIPDEHVSYDTLLTLEPVWLKFIGIFESFYARD